MLSRKQCWHNIMKKYDENNEIINTSERSIITDKLLKKTKQVSFNKHIYTSLIPTRTELQLIEKTNGDLETDLYDETIYNSKIPDSLESLDLSQINLLKSCIKLPCIDKKEINTSSNNLRSRTFSNDKSNDKSKEIDVKNDVKNEVKKNIKKNKTFFYFHDDILRYITK